MPRIVECTVDFESHCKMCKHKDVPQEEDPCDECLGEPMNTDSDIPVRYEPAHKRDGRSQSRRRK